MTNLAPPTDAHADAAEQARLQALRSYSVLDTPTETGFDELTRLARDIFGVPIALISFIDEERQWFKSRQGVDVAQTPRSIAFCHVAIRQPGEVMVVCDASQDERFRENPLVTAEPHIRFYAGAPLVTPQGQALGTLCVMDRQPREFSASQRELLNLLSHQVMTLLELRRTNAELVRAMAQVHEAQSLGQLIVGSSPNGISIYELDGTCVTANQAMADHLGATLSQVQAQNFHQIDSWKQSGIYPLALRCLETGDSQHKLFEAQTSFGKKVYLALTFVAMEALAGRRLMLLISDLTAFRQAELAGEEARTQFAQLFQHVMDGVLLVLPEEGDILSANPAACVLLGYSEEALLRLHRADLFDPADGRQADLQAVQDSQGRVRGELRMRRADDSLFDAEISSSVYRDAAGQLRGSIMFRDITERKRWAARLQEQVDLIRNLSRHVPGVIYQYRLYPDGRSCFPYATEGIWSIYEVTPEQVREDASEVFNRLHPDDLAGVADSIRISAETLQAWRHEYRVVLPEQGLRWVRGDAQPERLPDGSHLWHGFIKDITERKEIETQTFHLAYYDGLTRLPNRALLRDRIEHSMALAQRNSQFGAVMFIDLDNFKQINDARGHSVGDRLLREVAQRLAGLLRAEDTVARIGGDEFVLLVNDLGHDEDSSARAAMAVAEKVRAALDCPYEIDSISYTSTGSIGIALFPKEGQQIDDLLRQADTAMYRAKGAGRNRIAFFELTMQHEVEERLALEQELKVALANGELQVYVQGQVDASSSMVGGELLLRWQHPQRGHIPPLKFIPVAEETGLILPMGEWVIEQACLAAVRLGAQGRQPSLSVNVSARQFRSDSFVERVRDILARTGALAQHLVFEVTESLFIQEWDTTLARMIELVKMGIRFSIDHFGTGYSSLAYLQRLPLFEIKIDRSFVLATPHEVNDTAIVSTILSMAKHLGLEVVAEGVETREQAEFLLASHCDRLQGYLFSRPQPMESWLADMGLSA